MASFRAPIENKLRALQYLGAFTKVNHEAALRVCADQKAFHAGSLTPPIFLLRTRSDLARKNAARLANWIQKIVPPLAAWRRPYFAPSAPVNALLTCPNTSDSTSSAGNAGLRVRSAALSIQSPSARIASRPIAYVDPRALSVCGHLSRWRSRRQTLTRKYKHTRPKAPNVAPPTIVPESEAEPLTRALQISPEPAPKQTTVRNKRIPRYIFIAHSALQTVCKSPSSQRRRCLHLGGSPPYHILLDSNWRRILSISAASVIFVRVGRW